jgi:hypothetical protein
MGLTSSQAEAINALMPGFQLYRVGDHLKESLEGDAPGDKLYVDANIGDDGGSYGESWDKPKRTLQGAVDLAYARGLDAVRIHGNGKFREEVVIPNGMGGVAFIGSAYRKPTHADAPWPSGFSWLAPASPTAATPLVKVRSQGCSFRRILFDAPVDAAAVLLEGNALSGDSEYSAGACRLIDCRFDSGQSGIEDSGGAGFVVVEGCQFYRLTNGIKTLNTAVAVPLNWIVQGCDFFDNTNHIIVSASRWAIRYNTFMKHTTVAISTVAVSSQGEYNSVHHNMLSGTYSEAGGYFADTTDEWYNFLKAGATSDLPAG